MKKFKNNLARRLAPKQQAIVAELLGDQARLEATPVDEFMSLLAV